MTVSPRSSRAVEAALAYASLGRQVFPAFEIDAAGVCVCRSPDCNSPGKHPRTEHGFKDATTNVELIAEWWSENPNANVAIRTGAESGDFALDVDPAKGGSESLAALVKLHGPLPETVEAITGGGGRHLEFVHPGVRVPNSIGFEPGLDIRGDGGYVIAAPSNHVSGGRYSWREGHAPGETALATAPQWLIELALRAATKSKEDTTRTERKKTTSAANRSDKCLAKLKKRGVGYVAKASPVAEGQRNKKAFSIAGNLAALVDRHGCRLGPAEIIELLSAWNAGCTPPLSSDELTHCVQSALTNGTAREDKPEDELPPLTDTGNAERLVASFGADVRYCHVWKKWYVWDGRCWRDDTCGIVMGHSKTIARQLYEDASKIEDPNAREATAAWARYSEKAERRKAMVVLAQSEHGVSIQPRQFDRHVELLNLANGTLDLRTFELRPHQRSDYLTKLCPTNYVADASCSTWTKFLARILPDDEHRNYFQRFVGYSITGEVSEQVLLIAHGDGANGKSTAFVALQQVFTTLAIQISTDLLIAKKQRNHPTEVADLFGVRLAIGTETDQDQHLDEVLVKQLTGGDRIRARRMREDFWEFAPTHKIVLITNHMPRIRGNEYAIWRRLHALAFEVTVPVAERDRDLPKKLFAEREGILAWAVQGCREWRRIGLSPPEGVQLKSVQALQPTAADVFVANFIERAPGVRTRASEFFQAVTAWARANKLDEVTQRVLGKALGAAGFGSKKSNGVTVYLDARLSHHWSGSQGPSGTNGDQLRVDPTVCPHEAFNAQEGPQGPCPSLNSAGKAQERGSNREDEVSTTVSAAPISVSETSDDGWVTA